MINTHLTDLLVKKQTFNRPKSAKNSVNRPRSVKTDPLGNPASNTGLGAIADQMCVQPADQGLVNTMVNMVSRMERSQQAMMDLMLQQAQVKQPENSGWI